MSYDVLDVNEIWTLIHHDLKIIGLLEIRFQASNEVVKILLNKESKRELLYLLPYLSFFRKKVLVLVNFCIAISK